MRDRESERVRGNEREGGGACERVHKKERQREREGERGREREREEEYTMVEKERG